MSITENGFDPSRYYLGTICKRNHSWKNSGQTLRIKRPDKTTGDCVFCKWKRPEGIQSDLYHGKNLEPVGDRYRLGKLCPKGHEYKSTGKSLKYKLSGDCVKCLTKSENPKLRDIPIQLENGFYLGTICPKNHNYQSTGKSLRTKHGCHECDKERKLRMYKKRKPKPEDTIRLSPILLLGSLCKRSHDFNETGKSLRYNATEPTKTAGCCIQCAKLGAKRRVHRLRAVHSMPYSVEDLSRRFLVFDNSCAYCQTAFANSVDHFIPISCGGSDVLGNLVPACKSCNSKKKDKDPYQWFSMQSFFSAKQWAKILSVLGKTKSNYLQVPLF